MHQATFAQSASISGIALHCGEPSRVTILPQAIDSGVSFRYKEAIVAAEVGNVGEMTANTTVLSAGGVEIRSVEHLLSALYALGITNCLVEIQGANEVPFLDGSARPWIELFLSMGIVQQEARRRVLEILNIVEYADGDSKYRAYPSHDLSISCSINFKHTIIGEQDYRYEHSPSNYVYEIALARSFLREPTNSPEGDIGHIRQRLKGFSYDQGVESAVILYNDRRYFTELRCEKEPVRHKILDFLGDLSLLGDAFRGRFVLVRPSHRANVRFAAYLRQQAIHALEETADRATGDRPSVTERPGA